MKSEFKHFGLVGKRALLERCGRATLTAENEIDAALLAMLSRVLNGFCTRHRYSRARLYGFLLGEVTEHFPDPLGELPGKIRSEPSQPAASGLSSAKTTEAGALGKVSEHDEGVTMAEQRKKTVKKAAKPRSAKKKAAKKKGAKRAAKKS